MVKAWRKVRLVRCASSSRWRWRCFRAAVWAQAPVAKKLLTVAADGSGQFKTVQEAVDSAPDGNVRINIKPGEYRALISISANGVELRGLGKTPEDIVLVYDNSAGTPGPDGKQLGTGRSATIMLTGDDFYRGKPDHRQRF